MTGAKQHAVTAETIFDGKAVHHDSAVIIENARISRIVPQSEVPVGIPIRALPPRAWLAPGFIDIQVNGGGDILFNDEPNPEGIAAIVAAHRRFGTTALLPTLISDTTEKMEMALDGVQRAASDNPSVLGIHWEGPSLSPEKSGVHDAQMIRLPSPREAEILTSLKNGVTLVTLAPERVPAGFITQLATAGIRVSLGHSMATYAQTRAAISEGLTGFTHLFNAMRPLTSREPGPIAAALETPNVWFGMIVDGAHVDPAMLRLALRGAAHPILVTDAMPPVGGSRSSFMLYGQEITVVAGRCTREDGTLAGAALDMASAVRNCVQLLQMPLTDALRLASAEPADFLGLGNQLGRIAPGYRADLVAFDPDNIAVWETWVAGKPTREQGIG